MIYLLSLILIGFKDYLHVLVLIENISDPRESGNIAAC